MSTEEFKVQLASVMDSAVEEAAKLFGTMVEELKAEIARIKGENDVLKAKCRSAEKMKGIACDLNASRTAEPGQSLGSSAVDKRDVGIQCALPLLRGPEWIGAPIRRTAGAQEAEEDDGAQMAFILIKQEELDNNEEYAPGYILLKQEDGPPTLIRRPNLREVPALLPSSLGALVSCYAPERPQKQPFSARLGPPSQRALVSQEAPPTPDQVRGRERQEEAPGVELPEASRTPSPSRSSESSPGREQYQEEDAPGTEQHPEAAEPERRERPLAEQQQQTPSALAEQQLAEQQQLAPLSAGIAEQPPTVTVTSPGRRQQQQQPPEVARQQQLPEPVPSGIEQLLAVAEDQLKRQKTRQKHPGTAQPSPTLQHLPTAAPSEFVHLLPAAQAQPPAAMPQVLETVTVSCQSPTAASKRPLSVHPELPGDLLPTVPDAPIPPASVSLTSSAELATSQTPRPDVTLEVSTSQTPRPDATLEVSTSLTPRPDVTLAASVGPSSRPSRSRQQEMITGQPTAVSPRQQTIATDQTVVGFVKKQEAAMAKQQTTAGSPRQQAMVSGQATVASPRRQTIVTDQTIVGFVKKQGVAMAKTVVDSLRQQSISTSQTNRSTTGSPQGQQLPSHVIVVSPRYQSLVTDQTAVAATQHQTSVIPQISARLPKQLPGAPHRIIVVSPSPPAGQTTTTSPRQQQPAVPAVSSAWPPPETERSAVATANTSIALLRLSALVPAEMMPNAPSRQLSKTPFLAQPSVPSDAEPDPPQVDSKDVDVPCHLPIGSTETMETRTVATEMSPGDTKEGLCAPSEDDSKELLIAHLRARLRPRPQPGTTETVPSHSPTGPKKPRMSNAANVVPKSNHLVNTRASDDQFGRGVTTLTPPGQSQAPAMTTRGRSTAQTQRVLSPQTQTPTSPPRSPLNGSPFSGTALAQAPSTPPTTTTTTTNCPRSSLKQPPPTTATGIQTIPGHQEYSFPQQQQTAGESPFQPLQRIGNRLLKNQCGACGRVLGSTAALEAHVSMHTGERPFSCTLCGKNFPNSKGLNRHARVHRGDSHPCPQCGKAFTYRFGLTKHMQMVHCHLRPFVCHVCEKGFFTRRDVEAHVMIHTGEKPYHCTLCEKSFKRRVELNVHLRWHNGEKRHWCPFCGKGFLDYNNLKRHKLIHTGEKPHQCPQCNKCFTQSGHLKKHLKNVHKVR